MPINGSGTISCIDPAVAPVVQQIKAEKQAEADRQAQATGQNVNIPYTLDYEASVQIEALATVQAEIDRAVQAEQAEQDTAKQNTRCPLNSFVAGTRVLLANGTSEPIQEVRVGDRIENATPGSQAVAAHTVTEIHRTDGDRDFVAVVITTPAGTATIDSTAHHLFYDLTLATWVDAAALAPGDRLQTTGDGSATVQAVRTYTAADRTYNLSVDGVHTYYVLAGATPVLVHNEDPLPTQTKGRNQPLTSKQASDLAAYLGYRDTGQRLKGQKIFTNGKTFISQDIGDGNGSHNGGTWKIAKSAKDLGSKTTRTATTDALLNEIGC
ncbi:toxin C-terminal domain-containing protein [Kitasatospora sp. NPDC008050]|uniref:toxin C-terminal domain-containing protein n=1 Tax=Kitasatospora sp. NPDC008050 TaxID=3364021 RepID=UPI0036F02075